MGRELTALAAPDEIFGVILGGLGDVALDVGLGRELLLHPAACLALRGIPADSVPWFEIPRHTCSFALLIRQQYG